MIESAEEFVRLRTSSNEDEYRRAAHDEAPLHVWIEVIDRYSDMRSWVAHNKTVPIAVLELLASDPDPDVRCAVADKRKLTAELFHALATDTDEDVRARIAHNRKVPKSVLECLASDPAGLVRDAAQTALAGRA
jgi:hypothetical protein